jgi:hypothetical protein
MKMMPLPVIRMSFAAAVLLAAGSSIAQTLGPDPGCTVSEAWSQQSNPWTDTLGVHNTNYLDANVNYWIQWLNNGPTGAQSPATIHGQFPASRYMSLSLYDSNLDELASIHDEHRPGPWPKQSVSDGRAPGHLHDYNRLREGAGKPCSKYPVYRRPIPSKDPLSHLLPE